ncbi:MAG: membrane protein insertion efficiency factor YidD [Candidatus Aegiribacteria sp.]|nr:membrane protein insertion efficiency factor YidD [Candidatus Aegiribacteria sp.]
MKFFLISLLILLLPVAGQDANIRDNSLSDILFFQYRGIFRDLLGRRCVYYPSCSHYGQEAIESRGYVFGIMMAIERWTRCTSAAFRYGDYRVTEGDKLADSVNPGEEVICWGRFLLPF